MFHHVFDAKTPNGYCRFVCIQPSRQPELCDELDKMGKPELKNEDFAIDEGTYDAACGIIRSRCPAYGNDEIDLLAILMCIVNGAIEREFREPEQPAPKDVAKRRKKSARRKIAAASRKPTKSDHLYAVYLELIQEKIDQRQLANRKARYRNPDLCISRLAYRQIRQHLKRMFPEHRYLVN